MDKKMYLGVTLNRVCSRKLALAVLVIYVFFASISLPARADEIDNARGVSTLILENLESKKFAQTWDQNVSDWFKERTTKAAFLGNMTIVHAQLGGVSTSRELVQQNQTLGQAASGFTGMVYSFMYDTQYPAAKVYETIVLIAEGNEIKLSGINYVPNPNPNSK